MTLTLDRKQARLIAKGILQALEDDAIEVLIVDDPRTELVRVHAQGRVVTSARRGREEKQSP